MVSSLTLLFIYRLYCFGIINGNLLKNLLKTLNRTIYDDVLIKISIYIYNFKNDMLKRKSENQCYVWRYHEVQYQRRIMKSWFPRMIKILNHSSCASRPCIFRLITDKEDFFAAAVRFEIGKYLIKINHISFSNGISNFL